MCQTYLCYSSGVVGYPPVEALAQSSVLGHAIMILADINTAELGPWKS